MPILYSNMNPLLLHDLDEDKILTDLGSISKYEHNLLYIRLDINNSVVLVWGEKLQLKADCYTNNYNRSTAQAILVFSITKMKSF